MWCHPMRQAAFGKNPALCFPLVLSFVAAAVSGMGLPSVSHGPPPRYGEEPFVALLETSTFGSPGGGKESVYRLYLVTTVWYFAII